MFECPKSTYVGRFIPKNRFQFKVSEQNEVEKITWLYKISPATLNISAGEWAEIEVIQVEVRNEKYDLGILKCIDSVIPYPILFVIKKGALVKLAISYKEPSKRDENVAKVDTIFETEWNDERIGNLEIKGLVTDVIYANFLSFVAGKKLNFKKDMDAQKPSLESVKDDVAKMKEREKIMKQIAALDRKIKAEPSVGKKQELAEEKFRLKQLIK